MFDSFSPRVRRAFAACPLWRGYWALQFSHAACVCMDVPRGTRGEWWMMRVSRGWRTCMSRGRRGTPDACRRLGRSWAVDPRGRHDESYILTGFIGIEKEFACNFAFQLEFNRNVIGI